IIELVDFFDHDVAKQTATKRRSTRRSRGGAKKTTTVEAKQEATTVEAKQEATESNDSVETTEAAE
ncbi:MAG TPA: hypothetical protein PKW37_07760, partial [Salinivirgaceae bacterium]|nr:hypothetical protein [Salinivirgaceae bacterium]